jgi:hypothetical protein
MGKAVSVTFSETDEREKTLYTAGTAGETFDESSPIILAS